MAEIIQKIRLAIVDDNKSTIQSLAEFINYSDSVEVVMTANSGTNFVEQLKRCQGDEMPQVVLTDVDMPGMNGIQTVQHGKALYPDLKFLMLTVYDDEDLLFDAIKAGASGYLLKDEKIPVIVDQIKQLITIGGAPMSPSIARRTLDLVKQSERTPSKNKNRQDHSYDLTQRENEVLQKVVDGLDYRAIAEALFISPHTVRKHIANIYDKLHVTSKAQVINLVKSRKILD